MSPVIEEIEKVENEQDKTASIQDKTASISIPEPVRRPKKKKSWLILGLLVLIFGMGAAYVFVIRPSSETTNKMPRRSVTGKRKPVKSIKSQKTQSQPIDSIGAGMVMPVAEPGQSDSIKALQTPIVDNRVINNTKPVKGHKKIKGPKAITEPVLAKENTENNNPVGESPEDTPKSVTPEIISGAASSIQTDLPEKESPSTEVAVSPDMPTEQVPLAEKTPGEDVALAPQSRPESEFFRDVMDTEEKSDSRAQSYYEKGVVYEQKRKFDQAIDFYKQTLALNPGHQQARINLASVLMQTGNFEEAKAHLTLLRVFLPEDRKILFNLGLVLFKLGEYSDAKDNLEELVKIDPYHLEARLLLASIYEEKGEINKAVELCEQAHNIDVNDPTALYKLGRALDLSGDGVEAAKYYQLYINSNLEKDDKLVLAVRERLNFLLLQKEGR